MANPDFPLAPWEVPPGSNVPLVAPADHVFDASWRGRETEVWVRQIRTANGNRTYFRDGNSDEIGNWLTGTNLFSPEFLQKMLNHKGFWNIDSNARRQFYVDGAPYDCPGPIELRIGREKGSWRLKHQVTYFQVPNWTAENFASRSPMRIERMAKKWLSQSDSEIRFALDWTYLSILQKKARILGLSDEALEDIESLVYYAFQIYVQGNSKKLEEASLIEWSIPFTIAMQSCLCGINRNGEFDEPVPDCLQSWREMLWRYYAVSFDETLSQWAREASQERCHSISVWTNQMTDFSAHERLETQLILHKWCKEAGLLKQFEALVAQ